MERLRLLSDPGPMITLTPRGYPSRVIRWGQRWQVGSAAFWVALTRDVHVEGDTSTLRRHRLGNNLHEEVAACLLGGHGMPYQVGLAAFGALRESGLLEKAVGVAEIEEVLRRPLSVEGRLTHYRFPRQKARYVSEALRRLHAETPPEDGLELRDWLLTLPGIGRKTSAWIVRNHMDCDDVAIIDIHILRAGIDAGVFLPDCTPTRDYDELEALFVCWAHVGGVRPADLDAVIWGERARSPRAYSSAP